MSLSYAVIGTGAIGGFYGGKLALKSDNIHFLLHSDYEFVKKNGFTVESINGNFHHSNLNIYKEAYAMPKCDVVLVGLKTTNNGILDTILPHITHSKSTVILIQNGWGMEEDLAQRFPQLSIAGALAFICSQKTEPGLIRHLDYGKLNIGPYNHQQPDILNQVCQDFVNAGIETHLFQDLRLPRWQKLVWNIPYNGLSVVLNTTTDRMMKDNSTRILIHDIMLEVINAANHCGTTIEESYASQMMKFTDNMRPYAPSMKLDWDYHRTLEIKYIYSRPVQTALAKGYNMKKVAMLEQQLQFLQHSRQ
jgi:2-dehydropantoate 2-reductase